MPNVDYWGLNQAISPCKCNFKIKVHFLSVTSSFRICSRNLGTFFYFGR